MGTRSPRNEPTKTRPGQSVFQDCSFGTSSGEPFLTSSLLALVVSAQVRDLQRICRVTLRTEATCLRQKMAKALMTAELPQQFLTAHSRPSVNGENQPVCVND